MKIGINLAAEMLRRNIEQEIAQSGCPAVIVRAVLEQQLAAAGARYNAAVSNEQQLYQDEQKKAEEAEKAAPAETQEPEEKGGAVDG